MSVEYSVLWYESFFKNGHAFESKIDLHHTVNYTLQAASSKTYILD